jgi:hypothetical protein
VAGDPPNDLVDRAYQVGASAVATPDAAAAAATVDRRAVILALGVIQIVLGAFSGLMGAAMLVGYAIGSKSMIGSLPGLAYLAPVINLLVTGIGSVSHARWARRATLISAGIWLTLMLFAAAVLLGSGDSGLLGRGEAAGFAVMVVPVLLVALALPIVLLAVYTRPSVRATFERRSK